MWILGPLLQESLTISLRKKPSRTTGCTAAGERRLLLVRTGVIQSVQLHHFRPRLVVQTALNLMQNWSHVRARDVTLFTQAAGQPGNLDRESSINIINQLVGQ
jgi:hypothetical protein